MIHKNPLIPLFSTGVKITEDSDLDAEVFIETCGCLFKNIPETINYRLLFTCKKCRIRFPNGLGSEFVSGYKMIVSFILYDYTGLVVNLTE